MYGLLPTPQLLLKGLPLLLLLLLLLLNMAQILLAPMLLILTSSSSRFSSALLELPTSSTRTWGRSISLGTILAMRS